MTHRNQRASFVNHITKPDLFKRHSGRMNTSMSLPAFVLSLWIVMAALTAHAADERSGQQVEQDVWLDQLLENVTVDYGKFRPLTDDSATSVVDRYGIEADAVFLHEDWKSTHGFGPAAFVKVVSGAEMGHWHRLEEALAGGAPRKQGNLSPALRRALADVVSDPSSDVEFDANLRIVSWRSTWRDGDDLYHRLNTLQWSADDQSVTQTVMLVADADFAQTSGDMARFFETMVVLMQ